MKELLLKAASSGVIAGVATKVLFGESGSINMLNMQVPTSVVSGACVAAGSVASDLTSTMIIEKMNVPQNIKSAEELAVRAGTCGVASTAVLVGLAGVPSSNAIQAFALGAGSKLGGDYAYDTVLDPAKGILPLF